MYTQLKKSKITQWWVAKLDLKMSFVNILSGEPLSGNLVVVGYFDKKTELFATSTNRVERITKNGVITARGTFYPFEEAHELYLQFLIEANKENTVIATNWDYAGISSDVTIIADIIRNGHLEKDVTFDFNSSNKYGVMFDGYSDKLSSNVVITTFSRRSFCLVITGIPEEVKADIALSSLLLENEKLERVKLVQKLYEEKFR